ncbi:hypothetical protein EV129_107292 [Rhizobium azibense]|uniref:Uncharacterized protein n=1 Tax=Rhizobium azibense TaxID=1136135 RepID=A0A4R3RP72_9HYPH|nr:hypothetical protein EV129_107292 [Rhizobium azibense]
MISVRFAPAAFPIAIVIAPFARWIVNSAAA